MLRLPLIQRSYFSPARQTAFGLWLAPALLLVLHYILTLDLPIRIWDEAIYANNALEMVSARNKFVLLNEGLPTLYNTKPPLVIWLQALSVAAIGPTEAAIRLPSLLAALATLALLVRYLRIFGCRPPGILVAGFMLAGSSGYTGVHVAATGDLDAVLVFWTTWIVFHLIRMLYYSSGESKADVMILGLLFLGGYLTKSTAIFLPLPGMAVLILGSAEGRKLLKRPMTYFVAFSFCLLLLLYYFPMEAMLPGYFNTVWHSEFSRLYRNIMPWHEQPWDFYLGNFAGASSPGGSCSSRRSCGLC